MKFGTCLFLEIQMALQAREVDKSWFHLSLLSCCCCWFKNLKVLAQSQKFSQQLLNEKSPLLLSSSKLIPLQTLIKTSLYCLLLCIYFCLLQKRISLLLQHMLASKNAKRNIIILAEHFEKIETRCTSVQRPPHYVPPHYVPTHYVLSTIDHVPFFIASVICEATPSEQ